jgi:glutathione S-transferase
LQSLGGEFKDMTTAKPLRDKFLGEMDKNNGFDDGKIEQSEKSVRKTVLRMETKLKDQPYLLGAEMTLADICVLPPLMWQKVRTKPASTSSAE